MSDVYKDMEALSKAVEPIKKETTEKTKAEAERKQKIKDKFDSSIKALKKIHSEISPVYSAGRKLTDAGNGNFGLFKRVSAENHLNLHILNKQTDYTAYFQYNIMESHAVVYFDNKTNNPTRIDSYDVKKMQEKNASESSHPEYITEIKINPDGEESELQKVIDVLAPYLDLYDKPIVEPKR